MSPCEGLSRYLVTHVSFVKFFSLKTSFCWESRDMKVDAVSDLSFQELGVAIILGRKNLPREEFLLF